jgi:RNA 2',3'-cyclic 3'-phosphodiesterase
LSGAAPQTRRPPARRLFFALWPDEEQRAALAHATRKAARASGGRPVPPESLHATLAFFGSVAAERVPELRALAGSAGAHLAPPEPWLALSFESIAHWPRAQVLCALAAEEAPGGEAVRALAHTLAVAGRAAGFTPDLKPFRAHVTVARKVLRAPAAQTMRPVRWCFDSFALIESRTDPEGAVYSVVQSYPLVEIQKVRT